MDAPHILIAGGGIGGLATALTLHQIGVRCTVFEAVDALRPLGVGINLQPNAVRELFDLGIGAEALDAIGVPTREWALVGLNGNDIYAEPRGRAAGYGWPQYSVHRGRLQMLLYREAVARLGADAIRTGHRVTGYITGSDGVTAQVQGPDGATREVGGTLLVGADGIHSAIRAQMHPDQPPINWGGAIMWRGTTRGAPIRTGASFVGLGTHAHRMALYPITHPDPADGLAEINWIAEVTVDASEGWKGGDWNKKVALDDFLHHFEGWRYDWLDVPALLRGAGDVWEYPMIDRDPVPTWVDGPAVLLGDAAHAMYPIGSNGASQAIVDARVLTREIRRHGAGGTALAAYDDARREDVNKVVLANRGDGPDKVLDVVAERAPDGFDRIEDVMSVAELERVAADYKAIAGFDVATLNARPSLMDL